MRLVYEGAAMASAKYLGYVGGAAVAVGVGAALATVGQGTAHAETDSTPTSAESKGPERKIENVRNALKADRADRADRAEKADRADTSDKKDPAAKLEKKLSKLADDVSSADRNAPQPKFDASYVVQKLQKQFKADAEQSPAKIQARIQSTVGAETEKATTRFTDLATKASEAAASLTKLAAITRADDIVHADLGVAGAEVTPATLSNMSLARAFTDDPGSDPFRADDPWPTSMPTRILSIEQATVGFLNATPLAALSPYYREGFEAVYRASQVVPWVNTPIPVSAILAALTAGDPAVAQVAINQLLLTTPPVSLLYYGFDQVADLLNAQGCCRRAEGCFLRRRVGHPQDPNQALHILASPASTSESN